jgi:threonyl-tRNA synthetase
MRILLPDDTALELPEGATGLDAAAAIGPRLAMATAAVKVNGEVRDLRLPLADGDRLQVLRVGDDEALPVLRHSTAHVLAEAARHLFPGVKVAFGPAVEHGFYYDFDFPEPLTDDDLARLETEMRRILAAGEWPFVRSEVSRAEAREHFEREGEVYKVEAIDRLPDDVPITFYRQDDFVDLCRGPHLQTTKPIKAFRLQSLAGAYWLGDADRPQLTRVYGTAFWKPADLEEHLHRLEEARRRDHRKVGPQLGLFTFSDVAPGAAFWLPNGTRVFNRLVELSREMCDAHGYTEVKTPQLYDASLWRTSQHWFKYRDNMFVTEADGRPMALKPMNCPGHAHLFGLQQWSYRDLPQRFSEPGLLHRNELSGALHGLLRVRHLVQDDAHIFCTPEQALDEAKGCLDMAFETYAQFGIEATLELSTRPDERIGDDAQWDEAEALLTRALEEKELEYTVNEGDGAFYGPKIDLHMTDSLGRSWQLGTVQMDFQLPERFDLTYTGADNAEHRVVMLHRALFGSYERFIGILLEDTGGDLPLWLAPEQALVLPIADRHGDYAREVVARLAEAGLRARADLRTESVGKKIAEAEAARVPIMLIVGDREQETGQVALRRHGRRDLGAHDLTALLRDLRTEVDRRVPA